MSAQTGLPNVIPAPPSSRRIDRARINVKRLRNDPNPVWMRELKQSARLTRTPVILAVITGVMALLMCSVGGVASVGSEPAKVGAALYHVFFSLAFAVVTWVAPAVAASTIASERSGRTWEALLLTGLSPATVARGKFLAALTYISLYIVMLVPVGALPFLFGGVTGTDVIAAFLLLLLLGVLSVAFGLSISSKFASSAVAIVVTLLVAVPLSLFVYLAGGVGLSFAAAELWPQMTRGAPVWLPTAYARADFGVEYVTFLIVMPLVCVIVPGWFLYEVTLANMTSVSDDRSSRMRRWFLVSMPLLTLATLPPVIFAGTSTWEATMLGATLVSLFGAFAAFVFAGEPLGPSRRVRVHWDRRSAGRIERFLGPGVVRATVLAVVITLASLGLLAAVGVATLAWRGAPAIDYTRVIAFCVYSMAFSLFLYGFASWTRARSKASTVPRILLISMWLLAAAGPFVAMAIAGILSDGSDAALVVASPSPLYPFWLMDQIGRPGQHDLALMAGAVAAAGWGFLGAGLLTGAAAKSRRVVREHEASIAKVDALLDAEENAAAPAPDAQAEPQPDPAHG